MISFVGRRKEIEKLRQAYAQRRHVLPLRPTDTALLVRSAVSTGRVSSSASNHIHELHLIARGNPRALEELVVELSSRLYNLDDSFDRKPLGLDRRIRHAAGLAAAQIEDD